MELWRWPTTLGIKKTLLALTKLDRPTLNKFSLSVRRKVWLATDNSTKFFLDACRPYLKKFLTSLPRPASHAHSKRLTTQIVDYIGDSAELYKVLLRELELSCGESVGWGGLFLCQKQFQI